MARFPFDFEPSGYCSDDLTRDKQAAWESAFDALPTRLSRIGIAP